MRSGRPLNLQGFLDVPASEWGALEFDGQATQSLTWVDGLARSGVLNERFSQAACLSESTMAPELQPEPAPAPVEMQVEPSLECT